MVSSEKLIADIRRAMAELTLPPESFLAGHETSAPFGSMNIVKGVEYLQQSEVRLFPESKNRSARIHKKLVKKHGGEFRMVPATFQFGDTLYMHPEHYRMLQNQSRTNEEAD